MYQLILLNIVITTASYWTFQQILTEMYGNIRQKLHSLVIYDFDSGDNILCNKNISGRPKGK